MTQEQFNDLITSTMRAHDKDIPEHLTTMEANAVHDQENASTGKADEIHFATKRSKWYRSAAVVLAAAVVVAAVVVSSVIVRRALTSQRPAQTASQEPAQTASQQPAQTASQQPAKTTASTPALPMWAGEVLGCDIPLPPSENLALTATFSSSSLGVAMNLRNENQASIAVPGITGAYFLNSSGTIVGVEAVPAVGLPDVTIKPGQSGTVEVGGSARSCARAPLPDGQYGFAIKMRVTTGGRDTYTFVLATATVKTGGVVAAVN